MSYAQRHTIYVTTAADGTATAYSPVVTGNISQIVYVKTDFATGVDFTITAESTGETIWTQLNVDASAVVAPRQATHSTAGVAALYAAAGSAVLDKIAIANDRVKFAIASGGDTKTGTFYLILN